MISFIDKQIVPARWIYAVAAIFIFSLTGCNNSSNTSDKSIDTGGIAFVLQKGSAQKSKATVLDCTGDGIDTIKAFVYGPESVLQGEGGPWSCSEQDDGTIQGIPEGSNKRVVIKAFSAAGEVILCGDKLGVEVVAGETTELEPIELTTFIPALELPQENSSYYEGDGIDFQWQAVTGVQRYRIEVASREDFSNAEISNEIETQTYGPITNLVSDNYWWRIKAIDQYDNESPWSTVGHFSIEEALEPRIRLSDSSSTFINCGGQYDFGSINVYETANSTFTIENTGNADLVISGVALTAGDTSDFSLSSSGFPVTLSVNGTWQFIVSARSENGGDKSATVSISSNATRFNPLEFHVLVSAVEFQGITIIDSDANVGSYSSIAVTDGIIYIAYYDETNGTLKVAKSINNGINWSDSTISDSNGDIGRGASIAVDEDNVFVSTTIENRIGMAKSIDGGETWDSFQILPSETRSYNGYYDEYSTSISLDGQQVYIAYLTSDILNMCILKSNNAGDDWTLTSIPPPSTTGEFEVENGYYASAKVLNQTLYVSHSGYTDGDLYFTRLPDSLDEHSDTKVDQVNQSGDKGYTSLAVSEVGSNTYVYIAYYDQSSDNQNLKFARSMNGGDNFSLVTIDESSTDVGKYPSLAISEQNLFVSYYDETNGNLKCAVSDDQGSSWQSFTVDSSTDDVGRFTSLAVDGDKVFISYYDATNGDLKFAKSLDGGMNWN